MEPELMPLLFKPALVAFFSSISDQSDDSVGYLWKMPRTHLFFISPFSLEFNDGSEEWKHEVINLDSYQLHLQLMILLDHHLWDKVNLLVTLPKQSPKPKIMHRKKKPKERK